MLQQDQWTDWASAAANVFLAASVFWGGLIALRRWDASFAIRDLDGPTHGDTANSGVVVRRDRTWTCEVALVGGQVAHIQRIKLQRRFVFLWLNVSGGTAPHNYMPISLRTGEGIKMFVSVPLGEPGPYRLKIDEYGSWRSTSIPFLEPQRQNDFA